MEAIPLLKGLVQKRVRQSIKNFPGLIQLPKYLEENNKVSMHSLAISFRVVAKRFYFDV